MVRPPLPRPGHLTGLTWPTTTPHPDGTPSGRGENNGRVRIENTLGARFHNYGNGRDAFHRLESDLRNSGLGSQAVANTQGRNGRAHAWNVVNHYGKITYIDAQTGQRSNKPLHDGDNGVHAIPLARQARAHRRIRRRQSRSETVPARRRPTQRDRKPCPGSRGQGFPIRMPRPTPTALEEIDEAGTESGTWTAAFHDAD
ncbi:toxin glutamine deamidase domain-containing protein [Streptomyces sp. NRRL S-1813]|uniref:toxin glutamine deamidase domain-containing protein n=1 Tax=Streptomyces sp. NRRL S-1813 TaxID=1463888 RepID=UPI0004CC35EF|nr:toxin glutamine deamidase domain-containing protein [Streptomyces sp. NRRL S-1813]